MKAEPRQPTFCPTAVAKDTLNNGSNLTLNAAACDETAAAPRAAAIDAVMQ
jgi:hypothetical protein